MPEVEKCKRCGSQRYEIQHMYSSYSQRLLVVICGDCKNEIIPVVVDDLIPQAGLYAKCETAWNDANKPSD